MTETQNTDNYEAIFGFPRPVKVERSPEAKARRAAFGALLAADRAEAAARAAAPLPKFTPAQYIAAAR